MTGCSQWQLFRSEGELLQQPAVHLEVYTELSLHENILNEFPIDRLHVQETEQHTQELPSLHNSQAFVSVLLVKRTPEVAARHKFQAQVIVLDIMVFFVLTVSLMCAFSRLCPQAQPTGDLVSKLYEVIGRVNPSVKFLSSCSVCFLKVGCIRADRIKQLYAQLPRRASLPSSPLLPHYQRQQHIKSTNLAV